MKVTCIEQWIINCPEEAAKIERDFAKAAEYVRKTRTQFPHGFHHQGRHWTQIYEYIPRNQYKPHIIRVVHRKYGPKNIKCLRKESLRGGRVRWVLSIHWEGHCPGCVKPVLIRRHTKLIRR